MDDDRLVKVRRRLRLRLLLHQRTKPKQPPKHSKKQSGLADDVVGWNSTLTYQFPYCQTAELFASKSVH